MGGNKISYLALKIFISAIGDYHILNTIKQKLKNPFSSNTFEFLLYKKNWIDTVQWHLEDIIRDPKIDPINGISLKRRIDKSNQERTDLVEKIDDYYLALFSKVEPKEAATLNTESPGWVVDRISILCLKIYHMNEQVIRNDVSAEHLNKCKNKLAVLLEQQEDISTAFDQLLTAYESGEKKIKVYRQMKMYNDDSLNPILYKK